MKDKLTNVYFLLLTLAFLIIVTSSTLAQRIWYVTETGAGSKDGSSWINAIDSLQNAIDSADIGDSIWIAEGTYQPTKLFGGMPDNYKTFYIDKSIKIFGGFKGTESFISERDWRSNPTIFDGAHASSDSSYRVIYIDGNSKNVSGLELDGLTVTNGRATGPFGFRKGAGILAGCNSGVCNFVIRNCTLYNNRASVGGGINIQVSGTGSDASPLIQSCSFIANESVTGGGISFEVNNLGKSSPKIFNNFYHANVAGQGGAIAYRATDGGESRPKIFGSTFINNEATIGGALLILNDNNPNLAFDLQSSILWNNGDEIESDDNPITTVYTLLDDGNPDGSINMPGVSDFGFNLDADPLFVDLSNGNASLKPGSPAIDAGWTDNVPAGIPMDLIGKPRINNQAIDMGAYENYCPDQGQPVFVDKQASGNQTGTTWANALNDLQEGIDQACACDTGTTLAVWVAEGLYLPTIKYFGDSEAHKTFYIDKDVKLYGSFKGNETSPGERKLSKHPTVLSGDLGVLDNNTDNTFTLVYIDGQADGLLSGDFLLDGFELTATGRTDGNGEGLLIDANITPITKINVANCIFHNHQNMIGAGFINNRGANLVIWNSLFYDNEATLGAALQNIGNLEIINGTFYNNTSANGTLFIRDPTNSNKTSDISNSIFWNTDPLVHLNNLTTTLTHSNYDDGIQDGTITYANGLLDGGNNIEMDPLFVDVIQKNFRLYRNSPSVNTADAIFIGSLADKDLDGFNRNTRGVDMGPYENPYRAPCLPEMVIDNTYGPIDGLYQSDNKLILGDGAVIESGANVLISAPQVDVEKNVTIQLGAQVQISGSGCGD